MNTAGTGVWRVEGQQNHGGVGGWKRRTIRGIQETLRSRQRAFRGDAVKDSARAERSLEHFVGDHIKFLLLLALDTITHAKGSQRIASPAQAHHTPRGYQGEQRRPRLPRLHFLGPFHAFLRLFDSKGSGPREKLQLVGEQHDKDSGTKG